MSSGDRFRLDGKVVLITGASTGIGAAMAVGFAEAGADVSIGARRIDRLEATGARVSAVGRTAFSSFLDVTIPEDCQRFVDETMDAFGHIDVLVNNAGVCPAVPAVRETPEQFRSTLNTNLMGSYWMARECARVMESGSSIVNIGSVIVMTTMRLPQAAYSASKTALTGLTRALAQEWTARRGIRVNLLVPGMFRTELTETSPKGYLEEMTADRVPMNRLGELEECVCAAIFLGSDASSYISGTMLPVDGGLLLT